MAFLIHLFIFITALIITICFWNLVNYIAEEYLMRIWWWQQIKFIPLGLVLIGIYLFLDFLRSKVFQDIGDHFKLGYNFYTQEKHNEALVEFEKVIKSNSKCYQAYFNAANIYYLRKEYDKALEYIRIVIKLKPKFGTAYLHLGKFLHVKEIEEVEKGINTQQLGLYKEAIELYKKALKLRLSEENRLQAHALLSEIYFQLGLINDGKKELQEVLKIEPNNKIAHDYLNELAKKGFIEKRGRFSFS
ncbi:MAG: tetratricopeptide repeat protein [bacterium]